jgi:hypothetical protein
MIGLKELLRRLVKRPLESRMGRLDVRLEHQRHVSSIPTIGEAIATMRARWPELDQGAPADQPVFLLAAAWRSGSTLLQRLVMSDPRMLMWGEPYANCDLLGHMASSLRIFRADYPTDEWFIGSGKPGDREGLTEQWIANLYPEAVDLIGAHRALFNRLYGAPARMQGYERWGLKEVRYGIEHARYLRFLFPRARFLFLYRSPYASWRSYRIWRNWYYRWPDRPIYTARDFGALWRELVEGFLAGAEEVGARVVKYEDLVAGRTDLADVGRYLGLDLRSEVMAQKVEGRGVRPDPVPVSEARLLRRAIGPVAERLGYLE